MGRSSCAVFLVPFVRIPRPGSRSAKSRIGTVWYQKVLIKYFMMRGCMFKLEWIKKLGVRLFTMRQYYGKLTLSSCRAPRKPSGAREFALRFFRLGPWLRAWKERHCEILMLLHIEPSYYHDDNDSLIFIENSCQV